MNHMEVHIASDPLYEALRRRIELTTSCRDTDALPAIEGAGQIEKMDGQPVQIMHNGVRVVAGGYYGWWMTEIIERLQGHHEPQEELAFHVIMERLAGDTPSPVVLELGAFWSYYSLWALHRAPLGRAILVEPDPNNLDVGRANFALNGRAGEFLQAAVGARQSAPRPFTCESDGVLRHVATESLESLLARYGLHHVDLLIADVQGAETPFLEGGRHLLADRVRFLLVSTHHHSISADPLTHQRCLGLLRDLGAHVIAEHTVGESFSGDGLIAVSFDHRDQDLTAPISYGRVGHTLFPDPLVDLAAAEAREAELVAAAVRIKQELVDVRATRTWRAHDRLGRSPWFRRAAAAVDAVARAASAHRRVS
jgi:FkbM family methyltransferase